SLSRFATRGDMDGFRTTVSTGLRQIAFLLVPAAAISAVLAEPIVRILFQRGHFTPGQTPGVAHSLAAFSAGLVFNGAMLMLNRAFFSLQSNWIPTAIALGNLFLNAVLDYAFYRVGIWGIPLATAVCNVAGTWALLVLLRGRLGPIGGSTGRTVAGVTLAAAARRRQGGVEDADLGRRGGPPDRRGRAQRHRARPAGRREVRRGDRAHRRRVRARRGGQPPFVARLREGRLPSCGRRRGGGAA